MRYQQLVSLLLATQMLTAPLVQAVSLSLPETETTEETTLTTPTPEATESVTDVVTPLPEEPEESTESVPTESASEQSPAPEEVITPAPEEKEEPAPVEETPPLEVVNPLNLVLSQTVASGFNDIFIGPAYGEYGAARVPAGETDSKYLDAGQKIDIAVERGSGNQTPIERYDFITSWDSKENGTFELADLIVAYGQQECSFLDLEKLLGRIPDREFDGWYVYGWGWGPTLRPVNYPMWSTDRDIPLDRAGPIDISEVHNQIVNTPEKATEINKTAPLDDQIWFHYEDKQLPVIAHWRLSDDATLVATADINPVSGVPPTQRESVLYGVGTDGTDGTVRTVTDKNLLNDLYDAPFNNGGVSTTFDPSASDRSYYLRVASNVSAVDLSLLASEPFRSSDIAADAGVKISVRQAGERTWTDTYTLEKTILNDSKYNAGNNRYFLYNSAAYPMRSEWKLDNQGGASYIPLALSSAEGYYNEIQVTVTSPSGKQDNTYTFFIQRLNDPKLEQRPGNTPLGMIERDTGDVWKQLVENSGNPYTTIAEAKAEAKRRFQEGGLTFSAEKVGIFRPGGPENNGGVYNKKGVYHTGAWGGGDSDDNVDLDETAIVVYQDSSFVDPGFTVIDSQGDRVSVSADNVKRSVTLRLADDTLRGLTVSDIKDNAGTPYYFNATTKQMEMVTEYVDTFQVVRDKDGRDRLDLRGARVVPGIYQIEYSFQDPLTGRTYTSNQNDFLEVNKDNADTFHRTLVILPIPGDVDMDGAVTIADAELLRRALHPSEGGKDVKFLDGSDKVIDLFKLRVCDVNNDGVVNDADVEALQDGFTPALARNSESDYFYLPLPSGLSEEEEAKWHARRELMVSTGVDATKGKLSLEFLGTNTDAITADPSVLDSASGDGQAVKRDDVFWVGIKVSDLAELRKASSTAATSGDKKAICGGIISLNLTIAYDAAYVEPALLPGTDSAGSEEEQWLATLRRYNIGDNVESPTHYLWGGHYEIAGGTQSGETYSTHYSKAILPLENAPAGSNLRELSVSIRCIDTSYRVLNQESEEADAFYLIRIPFKLHTFPFGTTQAQVLDMGLGMKELSLFSRLVPEDANIPQVAAAWSAQDEIYGGATRNLADELNYVGGSARSITLGKDETERVDLVNFSGGTAGKTVYGEPYLNHLNMTGLPGVSEKLPAGLTYHADTGDIDGTPEEVGDFEFEVVGGNGNRTIYRIRVEQAPLHLTAVAQERYYGEENAALDYTYKQSDIKALDRPGGKNYIAGFVEDGTSAQLTKLAGYQAPDVTTDVTKDTDAGEYVIAIGDASGGSGLTNYAFVYTDPEGNAAPAGQRAESPLVVKQRPLLITRLEDDASSPNNAMAKVCVWASDSKTLFQGELASYQATAAGKRQFVPKDLGGSYNGLPLTGGPICDGDTVEISFAASLTWEQTTLPHYIIPDGDATKQVDAKISNLTLVGDKTRRNYTLVESKLENTTAKATVLRNYVVDLKVDGVPKLEGYIYGEALMLYGLKVTLVYQDKTEISYNYVDETSFRGPGILLTWEDGKDSGPSRDDPARRLSHLQPLDAATHNGKYLCISAPTYVGGAAAGLVSWHAEKPFTVSKKSLTLTAQPKTVYYGEFGTSKDSPLTFTYDPAELSAEDQAYLKTAANKTVLEGTQEELERLPGYVAPLMKARTGIGGPEVTADTDAGNTYIISIGYEKEPDTDVILSGTNNYSFVFKSGSSVALWGENGYSSLIIKPRPIVVSSLTMGMDGAESRAFLYDDTSELTLSQMYRKSGETGEMVPERITATGCGGAAEPDTFAAALPQNNYYFTAGDDGYVQLESTLSGDAIHTRMEDGKPVLDQVVVRYSARYTPEDPAAAPLSGTPYFKMKPGETERLVDAQVRGLELVSGQGQNRNYTLVYDTQSTANSSKPKDDASKGVVRLRELKSVEFQTPGDRRSYVYGEELDLSGMSLRLVYEDEGDNALTQNASIIQRKLDYERRQSDGAWTDTFALQGLYLYWMTVGSTLPKDLNSLSADALTELLGEAVHAGDYPDVTVTGKELLLCGRRDASNPLVWAKTKEAASYTVTQKSLPLTVEAQNRYYGQPNGAYQAYCLFSSLAAPDQARLQAEYRGKNFTNTSKLYVTADGVVGVTQTAEGKDLSDRATSGELTFLDNSFQGPRFTTAGTQAAGRGKYTISLDPVDSSMANYMFNKNTGAVLTVFRRPIVVSKVCETPISTIYFNTEEIEFAAFARQNGQKADASTAGGVYTVLPSLVDGTYYYSMTDPEFVAAVNAGMSRDLSLGGASVYGTDSLSLAMTVVYPGVGSRETIPNNSHWVSQGVTVKDLVLNEGAENYILVYEDGTDQINRAPVDENATGRLDRRTINKIEIIQNPKMEYTYGEGLDLSALKVRITYDKLTDTGESFDPVEEVFYYQYGGLSANYWDSETLPSDNSAGVKERPAATGDHLTRAPDHTAERFVYNGKYLIISARAHETTNYARPVLVSDRETGKPMPIAVKPLELNYQLTAQGKVYDGTTGGSGGVTLTNPYVTPGGERDRIFVTTGAGYEQPDNGVTDPAYSDYTALQTHLEDEGYTFASGESGLTFTFFDPNVKYADERHTLAAPVAPEQWQSYWDSLDHAPKTSEKDSWDSYPDVASLPVLVSGMTLGGPDAANYDLDSGVGLTDNVDSLVKDTVPYAVIEKAERPITNEVLPQVSVDIHTNTVKLTYTKDLTSNNSDAYDSELHYEYGLDYLAQPEGGGAEELTRWGGADTWQDTFYFGGEKESCPYPDGYEPSKEPDPPRENEVVKGQVYRWAEDGEHWYDAADTALGKREPLPRNTVFWGAVRLAETHNYNASDTLSSSKDSDKEKNDALTAVEAEKKQVLDWATNHPATDVDTDPAPTPAPAAQTYVQRFKLISTSEETGKDGKRYTVETLESVWFSNLLQYEKKDVLDAALRNSNPTRYYAYYWDQDSSAEVKFEEGGLDLSKPFPVTIREKQPDGSVVEKDKEVNQDAKADIYVRTSGGGGSSYGNKIVISPASVRAVLGGESLTLTAQVYPDSAVYERRDWSSSDPRVVQVTWKGELLFVGVGQATVTVTTPSGLKDSISVTVTDPSGAQQGVGVGAEALLEEIAELGDSGFDFYFLEPFLFLDEESYFYPERLMDRAELVTTLARFYVPPEEWTWEGESSFPDLTGEEDYAQSAELMTQNGILTGLPDGTFGADQVATRAEMAAILCRMIGLEPERAEGGPHAFMDAGEEDTWAWPYIDALARVDVLNGTGGGYFYPDRKITRAEAAAMLSRILLSGANYAEGEQRNIPADVPEEHWGYGAILRAVNQVTPPGEYETLIRRGKNK